MKPLFSFSRSREDFPMFINRALDGVKVHPIGFWFIFWGELAERAAYYGMRAVLALFLTDVMLFDEGKSGMVASFFSAGCYLLTLAGGWVSDRYLGKFWTIIIFAFPYLVGYPLLGLTHGEMWMYFALVLLAIGSGVIKPNLSPLMGAMYDGKPKELRSQAFSWFYAGINLGGGATSLAVPWIRTHYGFSTAFLATAALMAVALFVFFLGKRFYPKHEVAMTYNRSKKTAKPVGEERADRAVLVRIVLVFVVIIFFWSVYDQTMSTWVFFAENYMNLYGFDPDQFQALNPWLIILLTPIFNAMWKWLKINKATTKMMIGFLTTAVCMGIMATAGFLASDGKVTSAWIVAAYVVVTLAELCISVVGLEFAFAEAPEHMRSRSTSVFLFTVFVGDILAGFLASIYPKLLPGYYFGLLTVMMLAVAGVFYFVARNFEHRKAVIAG